MNGLRFRWDSGSGDGEFGLVLSWIRLGWGGVGLDGAGQKTSNLSPCPVPPCSQTECKMSGQCGDRRRSKQRFGYGADRWIRRHTARGAQTRPHTELQIHLNFLPRDGIISTAGQFMADPEWSCKRWRNVYWTGRYSWEETKETRGQRVVYFQDDSSDLSC